MSTIQTRFGRGVDPFNLNPADVQLNDIAWALAHQCRFTGHTTAFYSVAQHSVLMAGHLWLGCGEEAADYALLHDASEAYLVDLASPIKQHPAMTLYRETEQRVQAMIYERFGLNPTPPDCVKSADLRMLATERRDLMVPSDRVKWQNLPDPYPTPIRPHSSPWLAYREFLDLLTRRFGDR